MNKPIELKIDNRYKAGKVIKKDGVLRGNKDTMRITEVPNPSNPLQPILMVGETLAKHLGNGGK